MLLKVRNLGSQSLDIAVDEVLAAVEKLVVPGPPGVDVQPVLSVLGNLESVQCIMCTEAAHLKHI